MTTYHFYSIQPEQPAEPKPPSRLNSSYLDTTQPSVYHDNPKRRCEPAREITNNGFRVVQDLGEIIRLISERQELRKRRAGPRKLIQGMNFDCEEWMLEIRLNELGNVVDHFIIVEGAYTLQNTKREQCFPRIMESNERISKWAHKIVYVYDDHPITGFLYWEAEVYYRDLIGLVGLQKLEADALAPDDLVIITDADEIPHPNFLHVLKTYEGFRTSINLHLIWTYYSYKWVNSASKTVNAIVSVGELSKAGNRTNQVRFNLLANTKNSWSTGPNMIVGWHCSWCMPTANFIDKMAHFAHSELNQARFKDIEWLTSMRQDGLWFPDAAPNGCLQSQIQMPAYVEANIQRFKEIST